MTVDLKVREAWFDRFVALARPKFIELGHPIPDKVKVSVGWSKGAKSSTVGVCWDKHTSSDGETINIFLVPTRGQDEALAVAGTLTHELQHAAVGTECQHRGEFAVLNRKMGFGGKATSSEEKSPELVEWLQGLLVELGPLPHVAMVLPEREKVQKTYQRPYGCVDHDYPEVRVRMTKKQAERVPLCGECREELSCFDDVGPA